MLAPRFRRIAAPLVDQSERAWRILCRENGADLAYTPMLNAKLMATEPAYVPRHFDPGDRPLVAQLAGHDPSHLVAAAKICAPHVDAIDFNLGCPQQIAQTGRYGAFLLEETPDTVMDCVRALVAALPSTPITAKMRLQSTSAATIHAAKQLQDAGISALCVHGRTRHQTNRLLGNGSADWEAIRSIVQALDIPVIANGGIDSFQAVDACMEQTGAAGVMAAEALLENPALFNANRPPLVVSTELALNAQADNAARIDQDALLMRYLELCDDHPPPKGISMLKEHVRKFVHHGLEQWPDLDDELFVSSTLPQVIGVAERLKKRGWVQPGFHTVIERSELSWHLRHRSTREERAKARAEAIGVEEEATRAGWHKSYSARAASKRHAAARKAVRRK